MAHSVGNSGAGLIVPNGFHRNHDVRIFDHDDVLDFLQDQQFRDSTNPRDKIYGTLDLVDCWCDGQFNMDYNVSISDVYRNAVASIIEQWTCLDISTAIHTVPCELRLAEFPT